MSSENVNKLFTANTNIRTIRSTGTLDFKASFNRTKFCDRNLPNRCEQYWCQLPPEVGAIEKLCTFKTSIKGGDYFQHGNWILSLCITCSDTCVGNYHCVYKVILADFRDCDIMYLYKFNCTLLWMLYCMCRTIKGWIWCLVFEGGESIGLSDSHSIEKK